MYVSTQSVTYNQNVSVNVIFMIRLTKNASKGMHIYMYACIAL